LTNEEQFHQRLREKGYGDGQFKEFAPDTGGPMHIRVFSVLLLAVRGEFTLARPDAAASYGPGQCFELPAGTEHAERTGPSGARVLPGKK
jgi:hypothetical protein